MKIVFFCYPSSSIYRSRQLSWSSVDPNLAHQVAKSYENQAQITRIMVFFFQLRHEKYHWSSSNPRAHASPMPRTDEYLKLVQSTNDVVAPGPGPPEKHRKGGGQWRTEHWKFKSK